MVVFTFTSLPSFTNTHSSFPPSVSSEYSDGAVTSSVVSQVDPALTCHHKGP